MVHAALFFTAVDCDRKPLYTSTAVVTIPSKTEEDIKWVTAKVFEDVCSRVSGVHDIVLHAASWVKNPEAVIDSEAMLQFGKGLSLAAVKWQAPRHKPRMSATEFDTYVQNLINNYGL
jgi:hypothetical protein